MTNQTGRSMVVEPGVGSRRLTAWAAAAAAIWAMDEASLSVLLSVAERCGEGPEAVAAALGRPLENTRTATVRDGVAVVPVVGPLFRRANLLTQVSGATSVEVLARDLQAAMENPQVRAVLLEVDSPGGEANGVGELAATVYGMRGRKPITAYVSNQGCSGAYWIASACERVIAADTAQLGSIGVVAVHRRDKDSRSVEFVSSQSPHKRPDLETEEGRSQVQRVVDDIAAVFVRDVARYRGATEDAVLSDFGGGGVLVGAAAVEARLADALGSFEGVLASLAGVGRSALGVRGRPGVGERGSGRMGAIEQEERARAEREAEAARGVEPPHSTAEIERLREQLREAEGRVTALETREAGLLAAEARRQVGDALAAMRFGEAGTVLAPGSRSALLEALMPLADEQRSAVLAAVQEQRFVALGAIGFAAADEQTVTLTAGEEGQVRAMAERNGLPFEEVKAKYLEVRGRRRAA